MSSEVLEIILDNPWIAIIALGFAFLSSFMVKFGARLAEILGDLIQKKVEKSES
ncbi:hypothetical protein ML462_07365 [Gramella lutea]|uniref:Uncharacterized protein n=1 Tax=Christiangramia lutea TaxID=1607951 RepID=A0A9X1V2B3_9FLAO|nr:hypothetical protein [Christiangramia lutea]MCH4822990.1 hypothetical protein [Christiangramia lutea]